MVVSAPISVVVRPVIAVAVIAPNCVALNRLTWVVFNAAISAGVRPCTCVVVSAAICVVVRPVIAVVVSAPISDEVKPPNCVAVSPVISVDVKPLTAKVVSHGIWAAVKPGICAVVIPAMSVAVSDATCVVVNLFRIPGEPEVMDQCIQNILRIKPECDRFSVPLMVEPLVFQPNTKAGGYMVDGDLDKILPVVRQAVELGADIIKADPTDAVVDYHRVVEIAGRIPVLVRGGGKAADAEILARTETLIQQGAAGIVYGRNIIQHTDPAGMTRALMAIVHDGATAAEAARFIRA